VLRLPPPQGHEVMVAGIDTLPRMRAFVTSHGDCRVRDEQPMLLSWTPAQTMRSTVTDRPAMRFYRDLTELPARQLPVESRALTR
jgi:hypothetical protein